MATKTVVAVDLSWSSMARTHLTSSLAAVVVVLQLQIVWVVLVIYQSGTDKSLNKVLLLRVTGLPAADQTETVDLLQVVANMVLLVLDSSATVATVVHTVVLPLAEQAM
jgi:hypothetical protein